MELRHLRYFIKAAELLHFTKAAEALYISQPTLSVHIQQLEEELGTELFARVGRNVRLTEAGELLLVRAREAVRELELATEEIEAVTGLLRGTLNISALPLFSSTYLPGWITKFNSLHPQVLVKARSGASEDIETGLSVGTVDLAFTMLPLEHGELNFKELFSDEVLLAVSKKHPLAARKRLEPKDLHGLEIGMPSIRIATARLARKYFDELHVQPSVIVEFDDGNALVAIASLGSLAVVVPTAAYIKDPGIVYFPLPGKGIRYTAAAVWMRLSPAARAFLEVVVAESKKQNPSIDTTGRDKVSVHRK